MIVRPAEEVILDDLELSSWVFESKLILGVVHYRRGTLVHLLDKSGSVFIYLSLFKLRFYFSLHKIFKL